MLFKIRPSFLVEKDYEERTTVFEIDLKPNDVKLQRKVFFEKEIYLRDVAEQKPFVTVSHDLIVSPMNFMFAINVFPQSV